jgi:flagellin-like hook-associated protein FlgL
MLIANNATPGLFKTSYGKQNSFLQNSMLKLSTGKKLASVGDNPAELGISQNFKSQMTGSKAADSVIQNSINMFQVADSVFGTAQDMLDRMLELAISANDGSKNQDDLKNLNIEFQQLKHEIGRSAEETQYNGLQVAGGSSVAMYDFNENTIKYVQSDGSNEQDIGINLAAGNSSSNGIEYSFVNTANDIGPYIFADNGNTLVYLMQGTSFDSDVSDTFARLDIRSDTILTSSNMQLGDVPQSTGSTTTLAAQVSFVTDDEGSIWFSDINDSTAGTPAAGGAGAITNYTLTKLDVDNWSKDAGGVASTNSWVGGSTLVASDEFAIYDGYSYAFVADVTPTATEVNFVKQSIYDQSDSKVLLTDVGDATGSLGFALDFAADNIAVSQDGQYLAIEDGDSGTLQIFNTSTGKSASMSVGTTVDSIVDMKFDRNNNIIWSDTGAATNANAIFKAAVIFGDKPVIGPAERILDGTVGGFGAASSAAAVEGAGLSLAGISPSSSYSFQVGADAGMEVSLETGNIELVALGISRLRIDSVEGAKEAIKSIPKAISELSNIRSRIGAQVSRLNFTRDGNLAYLDNISQAHSRLTDTDFAEEAAKLSKAQVAAQSSLSIMQKFNQSAMSVLGLLQ